MGRALFVASALLASFASPTQAQGTGSHFCLRGAPPPACRGFIRVEVRGGGPPGDPVGRYQYTGTTAPDGSFLPTDSVPWADFGDWIGAEVGYALNVGDRWAVGASVALETGNESTRYLVRARARRWLTGRLYGEVLPGVFHQERDMLYRSGDGLARGTGLTVEGRAGLAGVLFASVRYDVMDVDPVTIPFVTGGGSFFDPGGRAHSLSVGGGLEGLTAILSTSAVLIIGAVVVMVGGGPIA